MPPAVISQFVEIFAWDVNFQTDLREGDSFKVFFRRKHRNGDGAHASFRILVAELTNRGRKYSALYFQQKEKEGHYYDLEGRPRGRSFLRYPVKFSRISSTFRHARFHPILKIRRPHRGVDFVAKRGTPVRAVGSGTITHAGWKRGGYGRFIEIQHSPGFRTRYAHLHKFARGIRRGRTVEKGQVIGYVGCSGLCTGPHLHFELYKNQRYRDPLKIKLPPAERIEPKLRKVFENAKQRLLTELADSRAS